MIGGRIYDAPPRKAISPYLVIGRHEIRPLGGTPSAGAGEAQEIVLTLSILSQAEGLAEARDTAAAMRVVFVDVYRGADGRTCLGLVRLRAAVEPQ